MNEINPEIRERLKEVNILNYEDTSDAFLYLFAIYYELSTDTIDKRVINTVNIAKIVERDYSNKILVWNIKLFKSELEPVDENWDWVNTEYRQLFKNINPNRAGDKAGTLNKMKKYFSLHPIIRKDEIIDAAKMYIQLEIVNQSKENYLTSADYFISKQLDGVKQSKLDMYIEMIREQGSNNDGRFKVIR